MFSNRRRRSSPTRPRSRRSSTRSGTKRRKVLDGIQAAPIDKLPVIDKWITQRGSADGLDPTRLAVAGDSVGGNMTAVLAILAKQRGT